MAKNAATDRSNSATGESGGSTWRTAVTLLLIFHFFALGIGVLSAARPLSALRNRLADVPFIRPYLQILHMDVAYNFHLTDGTEFDVDHVVVVEPQEVTRGEDAERRALRLPERGLAPGIRRERFQQLAFFAAPGENSDPATKTLLPRAIGVGLLRAAGAPDGTYRFRIRRQMLVARENADSPDKSQSDPYAPNRYETAFEGAVILSDPRPDFLEIAPEGQRAGVRGGNGESGTQP